MEMKSQEAYKWKQYNQENTLIKWYIDNYKIGLIPANSGNTRVQTLHVTIYIYKALFCESVCLSSEEGRDLKIDTDLPWCI